MSGSASNADASSSGDSRWKKWGKTAFDKSIVVSDWASGYANSASAKMGGERFWPKSNDFPEEITKCERILRAFTVEGVETKSDKAPAPSDNADTSELTYEEELAARQKKKDESFVHKKRKVLRKIPPAVIKRAKGIVIYTAMRSGIAPFGGAGGAGLMLARLPDGSWSAPSSISPNNLSVGLLLGFDIFDVILVVNSERAMEAFKSHKVTLGAETAVAAGPFGTGISGELGIDRSPVFSYVRSRGLYGGVEAMAQAFLHRFDENERIYYWPGITARDILEGKVRKPPLVDPLYRALRDAETGVAQGDSLERTVYETVHAPPNVAVRQMQKEESVDMLEDGERLKLPPTPEELDAMEAAGIPDDFDLALEAKEKEEAERRAIEEKKEIMALPPPPRHKKVAGYWENRGAVPGGKRRVAPPPSSLQQETKAVDEEEEKMDLIDLDGPSKPPLPVRPREPFRAADSLADEMEKAKLDGDVMAYEAGEASMPLDAEAEPVALVVNEPTAETPASPVKATLLEEESLSRASSLSRPSRPPRRGARPVTPLAATSATHSRPPFRLFFDWDETISASDTLSLIAPPPGTQHHGPDFSSYTEAYMSDMSDFESSFGERSNWTQQLEFLEKIDQVEVKSVARVEDGGLFRGMSKTELLRRAEEVELRSGWDEFYAWLSSEVAEGKVAADVISVGWSGDFIRHAITSRASKAGVTREGINKVYANEVEMEEGVGTGKMTKSFPLILPSEEDGGKAGIRTGMHKREIMQSQAAALKVYVGDSTTDLPCLVTADYGLIMKPEGEFAGSSINKTIQSTQPPIKKLFTDHTGFLSHTGAIAGEGAVLIRVDDWTKALEVIKKIQELCIEAAV